MVTRLFVMLTYNNNTYRGSNKHGETLGLCEIGKKIEFQHDGGKIILNSNRKNILSLYFAWNIIYSVC